jgi:hypothetical protein
MLEGIGDGVVKSQGYGVRIDSVPLEQELLIALEQELPIASEQELPVVCDPHSIMDLNLDLHLQVELVFLRDVCRQNGYNDQQIHRVLNCCPNIS